MIGIDFGFGPVEGELERTTLEGRREIQDRATQQLLSRPLQNFASPPIGGQIAVVFID